MEKTINDCLSELLSALGFDCMAADVKGETDKRRLGRYARIIVKQSSEPYKTQLFYRFKSLNLI